MNVVDARVPDVGGPAIEVSVYVDVPGETESLDLPQSDVPIDVRDVTSDKADFGDVPTNSDLPQDLLSELLSDLPADVLADLAADLPADLAADLAADLPADLAADLAADLPNADLPSDAPSGHTCSNPGWAKQVGYGQKGWLTGDKEGNPFVANTFFNTLDSAVLGGGYDLVVAKIKGTDGSILWSRQIGGTGDQACTAAAVDDSGNVFIAGTFYGQLDFGGGALSPVPTIGSAVPWIAKLSGTDGSTISGTSASPAASGRTQGVLYGIDTDPAGNVAIVGSFTNALTFGSTTLISAGLYDAYAAKFGPALALSWAKRWGDAKTQAATAVAFDSSGDLTVVGPFYGTINLGATGAILTAASDATGSNTDIFFARLSGATGDSNCALAYGDPGAQDAFNVVVSRFATGATKDTTFALGQFAGNSVLSFGSVSLDATGLVAANYFWLAKF